MLLNDFIDIMNKLAPQETALGFDNVGLIIGTDLKVAVDLEQSGFVQVDLDEGVLVDADIGVDGERA